MNADCPNCDGANVECTAVAMGELGCRETWQCNDCGLTFPRPCNSPPAPWASLHAYEVKIPSWSEGKPAFFSARAVNPRDAITMLIQWINRYAGYRYCDRLPANCVVRLRD